MCDLAVEISKHSSEFMDSKFDSFCTALSTQGLEQALDQGSLQKETNEGIRRIVWNHVNDKDLDFWRDYSFDNSFALSDLISKIIQASPNKASIVTTNYDRLAEYATDHIGATAITGFEGALIRRMEFPTSVTAKRRVRSRERQVEIWKVHGSLDWFCKNDDSIISFPLA